MKRVLLITLILTLGSPVCSFVSPIRAQQVVSTTAEQMDVYFKTLIDTTSTTPVVNILCNLEDGETGFRYHSAFGAVDLENSAPARADHAFKIASITKMFTAVTVLQLAEEGAFGLDDPMAKYLGDYPFVQIDSLHLWEGRSFGRDITIGQLLAHRSGLADIFTDREAEFFATIMADPQQQWSPEALFDLYYRMQLHKEARFEPGKGYAYSDTGYFLLGLLIEAETGMELPEVFRKRILNPLGMDHTYFEYYESVPATRPQVHAFVGELDATAHINTSFDWAGGGLVSTTRELSRFIQALFKGDLFQKDTTLNLMLGDSDYGYGIGRFVFNGTTFYGHTGFWGSGLFYDPVSGTTLCLSLNQANTGFSMRTVIETLLRNLP